MKHFPELPVDDDTQVQPLLTKCGVAMYLGVSERTFDRLVAAGHLRAYRIGRHRRIRLFELEEYVEGQQVEAW
jgi:excisionase family DNA binding protein